MLRFHPQFASLIWFRQFSIPSNSSSLALFAFQWNDFNKSMTIQYTFCIKIFVLLSCYSGFMLPRSLSDVYNNRLCFVFCFKKFSYSPIVMCRLAAWAQQPSQHAKITVDSFHCRRYFAWRGNGKYRNFSKRLSNEEIKMSRHQSEKHSAQKLFCLLKIRKFAEKKIRPRIAANEIVQFSINIINSSTQCKQRSFQISSFWKTVNKLRRQKVFPEKLSSLKATLQANLLCL